MARFTSIHVCSLKMVLEFFVCFGNRISSLLTLKQPAPQSEASLEKNNSKNTLKHYDFYYG